MFQRFTTKEPNVRSLPLTSSGATAIAVSSNIEYLSFDLFKKLITFPKIPLFNWSMLVAVYPKVYDCFSVLSGGFFTG